MSEKRRDNKGRILRNGEMQLKNGQYRYKYVDIAGRTRVVYSWKLVKTDPTPDNKRSGLSLRELEKKLEADRFDHIVSCGGDLTVLELVEKYISIKIRVRATTLAGYRTVVNLLKKDPFGRKRIDTVRISEAKRWFIKLQQEDGKGYSSICSIRGVLCPAFQLAVDDDLIRKNPFDFPVVDVVINDSVTREAISREEERKFLKFVKEDPHFSRYYEGIYILFNTGLRISEFCGLTISDIDFDNHYFNVDHQLMKRAKVGYYIERPKTKSGTRKIPMTPDIERCFKKIIANRGKRKIEPNVDGYMGFLYFDKDGSIMYSLHWEKYFKHICEKYNSTHKVPIPKITPHVCRHTYCSNMAKSGMNPKTLQYLMGHSDIGVTFNVYTHFGYEEAKDEVLKMAQST